MRLYFIISYPNKPVIVTYVIVTYYPVQTLMVHNWYILRSSPAVSLNWVGCITRMLLQQLLEKLHRYTSVSSYRPAETSSVSPRKEDLTSGRGSRVTPRVHNNSAFTSFGSGSFYVNAVTTARSVRTKMSWLLEKFHQFHGKYLIFAWVNQNQTEIVGIIEFAP